MSSTTNFKIDPLLAFILGESYRSSEYALKALIDNAWYAEATEVRITLQTILSGGTIIIVDNGVKRAHPTYLDSPNKATN